MNTIFKLNEKLENSPSILSIEDELFLLIDYKHYLLMKLGKIKKYLRELSQLSKNLTKTTGYLK